MWQFDACPVCHAGGRAERRYLDWRRHEERADAIDLHQEPGLLCAATFTISPPPMPEAGERAATRVRERWLHEVSGVLKHWPTAASGWRLLRRHRRCRRHASRSRSARRAAPGTVPKSVTSTCCCGCSLNDPTQRRMRRRTASAFATRMLAGDGSAAALVRARCGRASVVDWEIAEAARKKGWTPAMNAPAQNRRRGCA